MSEHKIPIPSMLYNAAVGGHVTNSQQIIDEDYNLEQKDINKETLGVPYNASNPNGMGKIVLKKNDNFKQVIESQTNGNTIFVIKYDFTLTDNVTVPANCVLEFEGGSINGAYTITGNKTGIKACLVKIFNTNITLAVTWNINEGFPEWFGAKGDGVTDDRLAIQKTLDSFYKVILGRKRYHIASFTDSINKVCINVPGERIFMGSAVPVEGQDIMNIDVSTDIAPSIVIGLNLRTHIEKIAVDCNLTDLLGNEAKTAAFGTVGSNFQAKLTIKNCDAGYCYYGYNLCTYNSVIEGNHVGGAAIGFFIHGQVNQYDAPVNDGAYGTSIFYNKNYADYCHFIGHKFAALVYSSFSANAADHCGYTGNTITTGGASYYCTFLRECCFKANGSETSFLCLKVSAVQRCSFEDMCFFINSNVDSIYGEDNKPFIELINNTECIFKTFEVSGSWTNKKGRIRMYSDYPQNGQIIENININGGIEQTILNLEGYAGAGNDNTQRSGIATFVPKAGPTAVRTTIPIGNNINAGITFYDRTLNKLLVSNMGSWLDAIGTPV